MFDTIHAELTAEQCGGVDFLSYVPQFMDGSRNEWRNKEGKVMQVGGYFKNMRITAKEFRVIVKGSLHKFAKGENITPMTIDEAAEAVEQMSAALCLPIERATVRRFDFGACMEMNEPVENCLQILGRLVYKRRAVAKRIQDSATSLRYEMRYKSKEAAVELAIYDKIAEMKNKREAIHEKYRGTNQLRAEIRFCKSVASYFGMERVTVGDLCSPTIWRAAVDIWEQTINKIEKVETNEMREGACESLEAFKLRFLRRSVAACGGVEAFIEKEIKAKQERGEMSKQVAYKCRELTRKACKCGPSEGGSAIVEEFNKKVEETADRGA